ncbi:MAG TPA: PfaD family polyunsaturated fatty acid/polyketide biosynthesis protein [Bacteroidia bacterium]|nr:PfaD family polyunsaturated fatty acid/polyketide biosynthesis protein [Bacteroidia bacterium]
MPVFDFDGIGISASQIRETHHILYQKDTNQLGLSIQGRISGAPGTEGGHYPLIGIIPAVYPEWLGDRSFQQTHQVRFAYVGGAMARGIASARLVIALAEAGMLGFFGSAGLSLDRLQKEIDTIQSRLQAQGLSWGMNLIHTPNEPELEGSIVNLYLQKGVNKIEAAAFMGLSKAIVHFAFKGLSQDNQGTIIRMNHVFAKISRPEVAWHFLAPVPAELLHTLVNEGKLTPLEAELGKRLCVAEDITVESDSGGHTDGRPLGPLFSEILQLRNRLSEAYGYAVWPRIGAAGGLGTPLAVASAYALGAAYVCVGSVHQSCIESGMSAAGKNMLSHAGLADVALTACADMFEQGVKVQVLKRGTLMPQRGNYLYSLYSNYRSLEQIPSKDRIKLEKEIFRNSLETIWEETEAFFKRIEPSQVARAASDPHHKMALIFRWYIGKSSQWPLQEIADRQLDYQIWCGPAMGAFNQWVKGTFLEAVENRTVKQVALNLLEGAARITKANQLKTHGVSIREEAFAYSPTRLN